MVVVGVKVVGVGVVVDLVPVLVVVVVLQEVMIGYRYPIAVLVGCSSADRAQRASRRERGPTHPPRWDSRL